MMAGWYPAETARCGPSRETAKQNERGSSMKVTGIYIHQTKAEPYAEQIVRGLKSIETRFRDTLGQFVGDRVYIVRTQSGKKPAIVGSVSITGKAFCDADELNDIRNLTRIPAGSKYDDLDGRGKWCYKLEEAYRAERPILLEDCIVSWKTRTFCTIIL